MQQNKEENPENDNPEIWDTYIASYDDGPGITTLRMDLIENAPLASYGHVLMTGVKYSTTREDGFPEEEGLPKLYEISDALTHHLDTQSDAVQVATFTHDGSRIEYFYLNNIEGVEDLLVEFYEARYPSEDYFISIKEDDEWEYYLDFLYPNEEIINYMSDRNVVMALENEGDILVAPRRIDHWFYFNKDQEREAFIQEVFDLGFFIDKKAEIDHVDYPFQLQIYRDDTAILEDLHDTTTELREMVEKHNGLYDGWETIVVKTKEER